MMDVATAEALINAARKAKPTLALPDAFSPRQKPGKVYLGAVLEEFDAVLAAGVLVSESAQLLDTAVNFQLARGKKHAVAILQPRDRPNGRVPPVFLARYQGNVSRAFGVVWVLGDSFRFAPEIRSVPAAELDLLVGKLTAHLAANSAPLQLRGSREAEEALLPHVDIVLSQEGFRQAPRSAWAYQGFWRKPRVDGLWVREHGDVRRLILEVKFGEDEHAPLSQLAEGLGEFDAAVQIRVGHFRTRRALRPDVEARLIAAKTAFEARCPVRYLTWNPPPAAAPP